jgi:serine protease AprX
VDADETDPWDNRVLCALGDLASRTITSDRRTLREMVAARFASRFDTKARLYEGDKPQWQNRVDEALQRLIDAGLVQDGPSGVNPDQTDPDSTFGLTKTGQDGVDQACEQASAEPERDLLAAGNGQPDSRDPLVAGVLTPALRERFGQNPESDPTEAWSTPWPIMIELNLRFQSGAADAMKRVNYLWRLVDGPGEPFPVSEYAVGELTTSQLERLVSADAAPLDWPKRAIYRIWPDFEAHPQIDGSSTTIKAVAAQRSFNSFGDGIVWGVVDSGVWAGHPHFCGYTTLTDASVRDLHRDFTVDTAEQQSPLSDDDGHGTHVAGIIAGGLEMWDPPPGTERKVIATEKRFNPGSPDSAFPIIQPRDVPDINLLAGMAPRAKLVSLKVLAAGDLSSRVSRVMRALAYVREVNASSDKLPRIHGVNLSLGYEFSAQWFACGQSPLCAEVDKLVRSGVVVVVAAGNTGYVTLNPKFATDVTRFSAAITINDPGNAERAITVGSTHRDSPHTFGVSYFSSRGPTGDGRAKPDLVAPGERITSAAAGKNLFAVEQANLQGLDGAAVYVEDSGTSMAAPHVSGAIAALLSVQRELIGKPEDIKRILVASATPLGRDPAFQGGGLVDLMRALQSV